MYSLYRAWFGGEESYPRLDRFSPPDVVVRVGNQSEQQFLAHKQVLASHSGYMKALLATLTHNPDGSGSSSTSEPGLASVSVSSVGGEAFAPLLNYMYTGRLEVTMENIYSVLLATHLLHMPSALEECRNALLRLRASPALSLSTPTTQTSNILRPVPSRLVAPFCWPQHGLYPSSPYLGHLQLPPAIPVLPQPIIHEALASSVAYSLRGTSTSPAASSSSQKPPPPPPPPLLQQQQSTRSRSRSISPVIARKSRPSLKNDDQASRRPYRSPVAPPTTTTTTSLSPSVSNEQISATELEQSTKQPPPPRVRSSSRNERKSSDALPSDVVFDVACCDGPVQFHRVLNENYAAPAGPLALAAAAAAATAAATAAAAAAVAKPSRNYNEDESSSENDENGRPENGSASSDAEARAFNGSYVCKYCRHTFKSLYCYRKHAKRHLLPTEAETAQHRSEPRGRAEQLQDLNVQYYPCKICGSKFPSYYFVHKHRKLCHSGVDDENVCSNAGEEPSVAPSTSESADSKN